MALHLTFHLVRLLGVFVIVDTCILVVGRKHSRRRLKKKDDEREFVSFPSFVHFLMKVRGKASVILAEKSKRKDDI
jgi:hypothetical protein